MDIEGLGRLIEEKHQQTLIMFQTVKEEMKAQREYCSSAMCSLEETVTDHEQTITRIKTIGSLLSLVWGAIVLLVSHLWGEWKRM